MSKESTKKGGTVVPPSDFQSESTKSTKLQQLPEKILAGAGARAHARANEATKILYVLIACEESQAECEAFRELGHVAFSCDVQKCRKKGHPEWHINADVTPFLDGLTLFYTQDGELRSVPRWDLIIAHPPCTYLCKLSSVQLAKNADYWITFAGKEKAVNADRYRKMLKARQFFLHCLNANATYVAVENPIPMKIADLPKATCFACPSWFGVKYTKKTLYWLKNLPPVMAEIINPKAKCYVNSSRGKYRSRTFPQLAKALARQWSEYILNQDK